MDIITVNKTIITAAVGLIGYTFYKLFKSKQISTIDGHGKTVLITGASSGIGKEFAYIYAEKGFNLVITSRSEDKLQQLADEVNQKYGVKVTVIPADLSDETEAVRLYEEIKKQNITIDQLINNAGAGKVGDVVDIDPTIMLNLIHLNVSSVTLLCRFFGNEMKKNGGGKILIVSSVAAFIPDPHFNVYGPTKAFDLHLSEAMCGELKGSGVTVSCLCPGPTKTNWCANAGKADTKGALDPATVAKYGFEGMQRGELVIIPGTFLKLGTYFLMMLPSFIKIALTEKWQSNLITSGKKEKKN